MSAPLAFRKYADNVFAEAIAVGCFPSLVGFPNSPMWRCDCPGRMHAAGGADGILTDLDLDRFKLWAHRGDK